MMTIHWFHAPATMQPVLAGYSIDLFVCSFVCFRNHHRLYAYNEHNKAASPRSIMFT